MHCNAHVQYKVYFFRAILRVELLHVQFDTLKPYVYKIKPRVTVVGFFFSQSPNLLFYRMDRTYMFLSDCIFQLYIIIQIKTHAHQYFFFFIQVHIHSHICKKKKKHITLVSTDIQTRYRNTSIYTYCTIYSAFGKNGFPI